jgi:hypothetical protein
MITDMVSMTQTSDCLATDAKQAGICCVTVVP